MTKLYFFSVQDKETGFIYEYKFTSRKKAVAEQSRLTALKGLRLVKSVNSYE